MPFQRGSVAQLFSSCASLNCRSMMVSFFSQNLALFVTAGILDARVFARATRVVRIGRVDREGKVGGWMAFTGGAPGACFTASYFIHTPNARHPAARFPFPCHPERVRAKA